MNDAVPSVFLTAQWRYLAMVNYEIDPAALRPFVPGGVEVDSHNGKTFVSLVGFNFLDTRIHGMPIPFHRNFEEINLRFYVRRRDVEGWRRGVVFIKEIVPRAAAALIARSLYNERYIALPMRHAIDLPGGVVRYEWLFEKEWNSIEVRPVGDAQLPAAGSEEEFITEHYWGYTAQKGGGTKEYRVEHPQWRVWRVSDQRVTVNAGKLYGERFREALSSAPFSAFLADGSEVSVLHGRRI